MQELFSNFRLGITFNWNKCWFVDSALKQFDWDGNQKNGSIGGPESSYVYKQRITEKDLTNLIFGLVYVAGNAMYVSN